MIILDTNVISEAMRGPGADRGVRDWLSNLGERPVTTVINRVEIMAGLAIMPAGSRRQRLTQAADQAFSELGVCLPLVPECAATYATAFALRHRAGRPIGAMDALIASIALVAGASIATRGTSDFEGLGLDLIDPWQPHP